MGKKTATKVWVGFDLGGTKMLAQVFDHKFYPLGRQRDRTQGHEGVKAGVQRIVDLIRATLEEVNLEPGELGGIGVGCPGPLDLNQGLILDAPNLGWKRVALKDELQRAFGCPALILNDVDAGVYGEYRFGAGRGGRCVLGVFPGTGIGGGCVYEGQILRGASGSCMEVGHMQVLPDGPLCGCGRRGCLEAVAGRLAIASAAARAAYRGDAPHLMENVGTDLRNIRSKALLNSIRGGDLAVEQIVRDAAGYIGVAVGNLVNLLLPERVVLGGGMIEAMPDLFIDEVRARANRRVMPAFENTFEVVAAQLGDDSAVMGAAAWAQHVVQPG